MSTRSVERPAAGLDARVGRRFRLPFGALRGRPVLIISLVVIGAFLVIAAFPTLLAQYSPEELRTGPRLDGPSAEHWLGTDHLGRDVASRLAYGIRTSVVLAFAAVAIAVVAGGVLGLLSGFLGGTVDLIFQRVVDAIMALPPLVLAIVVVLALGQSRVGVLLAIACIMAPTSIRIARGSALATSKQDFVLAAHSIGIPWHRMLIRYVAPAAIPPLIIIASVELGTVIIIESSLSFLGYGPPPPTPTLGGMLSDEGRRFMEGAPWLVYGPGVALSLLILAFNLAGDGVRDLMDPRTRRL